MKNQFTSRIVKFTFAFMFILIASSCNEDNDAMDAAVLAQENNSEIAAKGAKVSATDTYTSTISGMGSTFCVDDEQTFTLSGWNGTAALNVQIYDESILDWVSIDSFNGQLSSPQSLSYTFPAAGVYSLKYQVSGNAANGGTNGFVEFTVTAINCGCDESFSYVDNGDGSYTFTYIPAEDMEDALVVFTFAQGVTVSGLTGWSSNGVTMQKTMNLVACQPLIYTVFLTPNCSGNSNNSNVWTDFKVVNNDGDLFNDSKKNEETPTIVIACPN